MIQQEGHYISSLEFTILRPIVNRENLISLTKSNPSIYYRAVQESCLDALGKIQHYINGNPQIRFESEDTGPSWIRQFDTAHSILESRPLQRLKRLKYK